MAYDIFLSYARQDTERARQIRDLLEGLGLNVFFDTEGLDGGDVFPDILDRELKSAGAVVGVWSKHALTRPWVKIECDIGKTRGVLVPLQIEEISDLDRPAAFWNIQFADLSDFDGDPDHVGWLRFIRALARTLDREDLLERESAAQAAEPASDDAAVRAEMADMRNAKAELAAQVNQPSVAEVSATGLGVWQEIKDSDNPAAIRRFLETVRGTPLEHVVEAKLVELERAEAAPATTPTQTRDEAPATPAAPSKSKTPLILAAGLALTVGVAGLLYALGIITLPSSNSLDPEPVTISATTPAPPPANSVAYHEQACADGVATACMSAATAYAYGEDGATKDQYVAMSYYDIGCNLGDMEACWVAGISAEQAKDYDTARTYYDKACKGGAEDGCELLGSLEDMQADQAAEKAYTDAVIRLQQALIDKDFLDCCADGAPGAMTNRAIDRYRSEGPSALAKPYFNGSKTDTASINLIAREIERWTKPAPKPAAPLPSWAIGVTGSTNQSRLESCLADNMTQCNNLGYSYQIGRDIPQDDTKARLLYDKACDDSFMTSCYNLGDIYDYAKGVRQNFAEAERLYTKACNGGHMDSCTNLGVLFGNGRGRDRDYETARRYYEQACNGGGLGGCKNLGILYASGLGVTQDTSRARDYYTKACDGGNQDACDRAKKLSQ